MKISKIQYTLEGLKYSLGKDLSDKYRDEINYLLQITRDEEFAKLHLEELRFRSELLFKELIDE